MHGYFLFQLRPTKERALRTLVAFCSTTEPSADELIDSIKRHCETNLPPDNIVLLAPNDAASRCKDILDSDDFKTRLPLVTQYTDPPGALGAFFGLNGVTKQDIPADEIRQQGLSHIFSSRDALLEPSTGYHYIKPSHAHCNRFIRVANLLVSGAEITFIAYCALPLCPRGMTHIYCDTGAIHALAYALDSLLRRLEPTKLPATIDSYGSYDGYQTFGFHELHNSIVLISASTTGGLQKCLEARGVPSDRIITVFYAGHPDDAVRVVCQLLPGEGILRDKPIYTYPGEKCALCTSGSTPVQISVEHFLPQAVPIKPVELYAADVPKALSTFVTAFGGRGVIRVNYRDPNSRGASKDIFIDLSRFLDTKLPAHPFWKSLDRILQQCVPMAVQRILYLDDAASEKMAHIVGAFIESTAKRKVDIVSLSAVLTNYENAVLATGATVVVGGVVATGRNLLKASQVLRHIQKNGAIVYLIGIARIRNNDTMRELRINLTYGDKPHDYGMFLVERISLPVHRHDRQTSWDQELEVLRPLAEECADALAKEEFEMRIEHLLESQAVKNQGLSRRLFWPTSKAEDLELREHSVLFDFQYEQGELGQPEVFYAVYGFLHHMRSRGPSDDSRTLEQRGDVRKLLAPTSFLRFNDGVIQASLLRAADPTELDYSIDRVTSQRMREIIGFVLGNAGEAAGEAAREFLIALATHRLRLTISDTHQLCREFENRNEDGVLAALIEHIGRTYTEIERGRNWSI